MKILYVSLFPKVNNCHETENLKYFKDSSEYHKISDSFSYRLFTAHDKMLENLRSIFPCDGIPEDNIFDFKYNIHSMKLPFDSVYTSNMDERRAHEIAWCKQRMYMFMNKASEFFDYIIYNDADIKIDAKDVYDQCRILNNKNKGYKNRFINIPYVIKITKQVVSDSFGSFILPSTIFEFINDLTPNLYEVIEDEGVLHRRYAPDWILRKLLVNEGCVEIRGESFNTKHYISNVGYYEFDSSKVTYN